MCPLEVVSSIWWLHFKSLHAMKVIVKFWRLRVNKACAGTGVGLECLSVWENILNYLLSCS